MQVFKRPAVLLSLVIAACGGGTQSSPAPKTANAEQSDPSCPVDVPGTSVTVEDAAAGASLVFVTTGDVAELRRRVNAMASMHNDHHASMGALPDGKDAGGDHAGHDMGGQGGTGSGGHAGHDMSGGSKHAGHAGGMIGVHSKAEASDVESGARITFVANGADVAKLQSELRMHAEHFAAGTCGMSKS